MGTETYVDDTIARAGGVKMRTAAGDAAASAPGLIDQITGILNTTSWGEGKEAEAFEKAHHEVRGGLELAGRVVKLVDETANNVVTGIDDQVSADLVARSLIDAIPLGDLTQPPRA